MVPSITKCCPTAAITSRATPVAIVISLAITIIPIVINEPIAVLQGDGQGD
jgi:hypothetical protein